jgi:hypothetical protein
MSAAIDRRDPVSADHEPDRVPEGDERVMAMLHEHVPLSLLVDLTDPAGPVSAEILAEEGVPDSRWWEQ